MATHTTALSLYNAQLARFRATLLSVEQANRAMAHAGADDLKEMLSGSVSSKTLAQMGHPYARGTSAATNYVRSGNVARRGKRRGAKGSAPLRPINAQTGRLKGSVRFGQSGRFSYDVSVAAPYAKYVLHPAGTSLMVGRGVMSWHDKNKNYPVGVLTKRHRLRTRAYRDSFKKVVSQP